MSSLTVLSYESLHNLHKNRRKNCIQFRLVSLIADTMTFSIFATVPDLFFSAECESGVQCRF